MKICSGITPLTSLFYACVGITNLLVVRLLFFLVINDVSRDDTQTALAAYGQFLEPLFDL